MRNHLARLSEHHEVTAVANFTPDDLVNDWLPGVRLVTVPIARSISPYTDFRAFLALLHLFHREHFDVVHSITPKAGLLAMGAARLTGVPHRIHCFTGQVWATRHGYKRTLLKSADRIIATNARYLMADGLLQRTFIEREGIVRKGQVDVLGHGSIAGVDIERFRPNPEQRCKIRGELNVPQTSLLVLFIGRWNRDKGVLDLAQAFAQLMRTHDNVYLAMVGPDEADISSEFKQLCGDAMVHVRCVPYTPTPEHYMAAADVFVLPSYREGFNNVVIEAAACGTPSVASRIYGLADAVEDGVTGLLHPAGDVAGLRDALARLCDNPTLRTQMGAAARTHVQAYFSMTAMTEAFFAYYEKILGSATQS